MCTNTYSLPHLCKVGHLPIFPSGHVSHLYLGRCKYFWIWLWVTKVLPCHLLALKHDIFLPASPCWGNTAWSYTIPQRHLTSTSQGSWVLLICSFSHSLPLYCCFFVPCLPEQGVRDACLLPGVGGASLATWLFIGELELFMAMHFFFLAVSCHCKPCKKSSTSRAEKKCFEVAAGLDKPRFQRFQGFTFVASWWYTRQ